MKGCFVYCTDTETAEYLRGRLSYQKPTARLAELMLVAEEEVNEPNDTDGS
jgi:hypothetical protein